MSVRFATGITHTMQAIRVLLLCLLCIPALAAEGPVTKATASAQVDALFAPLSREFSPGAGVLVVWRGTIVHEAAYGYADVEEQSAADGRLDLPARFGIEAVHGDGDHAARARTVRLKYDDPIARYLPELAIYPGITVRNLLNHTGGLPEYYDDIDTSQGWPTQRGRAKSARARWRSRCLRRARAMNTAIRATTCSRRSSRALGSEVSPPSCTSASSSRSACSTRWSTTPRRPHVERRVLGYDPDGKGFKLNDEHPLNGIVGSGGVFTTLGDMYLWISRCTASDWCSRATLDQAFHRRTSSTTDRKIDYGFGWSMDEYRAHHVRIHARRRVGRVSQPHRAPSRHRADDRDPVESQRLRAGRVHRPHRRHLSRSARTGGRSRRLSRSRRAKT